MYITTEKSRGKWMIASIKLHTNFDTIIPLIKDINGRITRWVYIYEIEPNSGCPTAMKKKEIEMMSGLQYPKRL